MKVIYQLSFILICTLLFSCGKDSDPPISESDDYREEFVGIYNCTKSSRSFDDEDFTTDIEVIVVLDSLSDDSVIVNDITIPIDEFGRFETGPIGNSYYDLKLADGKIKWEVNVYFPFGLALPCYIQGELRN